MFRNWVDFFFPVQADTFYDFDANCFQEALSFFSFVIVFANIFVSSPSCIDHLSRLLLRLTKSIETNVSVQCLCFFDLNAASVQKS